MKLSKKIGDTIRDFVVKDHDEKINSYPYWAGFNSSAHDKNPYSYDRIVSYSHELTRISQKKTLTDEDKKRMVELRNIVDSSDYSLWNKGHFNREMYGDKLRHI